MRKFQKVSLKIEVIGTCPKSILSLEGTMGLQGLNIPLLKFLDFLDGDLYLVLVLFHYFFGIQGD